MIKDISILLLIWIFFFCMSFFVIKNIWSHNLDERINSLEKNRIELLPDNFDIGQSNSLNNAISFLGQLSMSDGRLHAKKLKIRFLNAGIHSEKARVTYFASKTFFSLIVPCFSFIYSYHQGHQVSFALALATFLAVLGYYLPDLILNILIRRRQKELIKSFPDALDLVRICVSSGLGLDAAIARVGEEIKLVSPVLAQEFEQLSFELRAGSARNNALSNLAMRTGLKDIEALVAMLKQANQFGTNVTEALYVFAEDLREKRKMRSREQAAKIPVKISLPIILCIFPALFVVILGPAIVSLFNTLRSTGNPFGH